MTRSVTSVLAVLCALAASVALAQPGPAASAPGMGPGMGAGPGAGMGPGMGRGPGGGMGRGMARWGDGVTPGWALMTPEERLQHQQTMRGFTSVDECRAYVRRHHAEMAARALSRGQAVPASPRRDPCAGLAR